MLFWVVATAPEAAALRDVRSLGLYQKIGAFDVFHDGNESEWLIRSGVGRVDVAMSIGALAASFSHVEHKVFANVGIAGARHHELGSVWGINKVIDAQTERTYYPGLIPIRGIPSTVCRTVDVVEHTYAHDSLYEMEAAGFMRATRRLSPTDGVGILKIVSDTPNHPVVNITKASIKASVLRASAAINALAGNLQKVGADLARRNAPPKFLNEALLQHRFSASQQIRLSKLLRRWSLLCPEESPLELISTHARSVVLDMLEQVMDDVVFELARDD